METEARQFHCPNCNADLKFSPDLQKFVCEFCKGEFTEAEAIAYMNQQDAFASQFDDGSQQTPLPPEQTPTDSQNAERTRFEEESRLYSCPSCGAEIVSDANTAASFCYYCHNPVILKGRVDGMYRPSMVLPFAFNKDKAVEIFMGWAKKKKFVPRDLVSSGQVEKLSGLYVPFWVADSSTSSYMEGLGENVRSWRVGDYQYTETKYYKVIRDATINYEGVTADGSQKIEDDLMEAIEPFDYSQARPFNMAYLSGFMADKYDVDKNQVFPRVRERMYNNNNDILQGSTHYHVIKNKRNFNRIDSLTFHYMLLPVWFMTFSYKGKLWEYAVNGQTGKLAGELPISKSKLAVTCSIIGTLIMLFFMIGGYLIT